MIFNFIILFVISASWGFGYLFVKIGESSVPPITEMMARAIIAVIALLVVCVILKKDLAGSFRRLWPFMAFGVLGITVPWLGIAFSEEGISSGLAAAMASTMPLFTYMITAFFMKTERVSLHGFMGLLLALAGLVLAIGLDRIIGHGSKLGEILMILGAFLSYAVNGIMVSRYASGTDPMVTITYTIGVGAIILTVMAFAYEEPLGTSLNVNDVSSLLGLGLVSTAFGFSGYYLLLKRAGPFFSSLIGYLAPVFGVVAGLIFLHEKTSALQLMGIALVLLGLFVVNKPKMLAALNRND